MIPEETKTTIQTESGEKQDFPLVARSRSVPIMISFLLERYRHLFLLMASYNCWCSGKSSLQGFELRYRSPQIWLRNVSLCIIELLLFFFDVISIFILILYIFYHVPSQQGNGVQMLRVVLLVISLFVQLICVVHWSAFLAPGFLILDWCFKLEKSKIFCNAFPEK